MSDDLNDHDMCAREPIHAPGAIQPHGALVVVLLDGPRILHLSANAAALTGLPLRLGHALDRLSGLGPEFASNVAPGWPAEIRRVTN